MNHRSMTSLVILSFLTLSACGDSGPDMKAGFAAELPKGWELESFKITVSEDVGTKVSPVTQHRFVAEVAPAENLFEKVATLLGKDVLKPVFEKGKDVEVHGVGVAVFTAGKWETHYQLENSPFFAGGQSVKSFSPNHVVIGSSDYRSLIQSAKGDMEKLEQQSRQLAGQIDQKMVELQKANADAQARINQASQQVAQSQQNNRAQQSSEYQAYSQKVQEISNKYAKQLSDERAVITKTFTEKKGALDAQYTSDIQKIRAEMTETGKWRQTERTRVQQEYTAALQDAQRKRLDANSMAAIKTSAGAKAKTEFDAIEEETRTKVQASRDREAKTTTDYRTQVSGLQADSQSAVNVLNEQINSARTGELAAEKKKYDDLLATSTGDVKQAQSDYNATVQSANERGRQLTTEINGMRNQINNNSRSIDNLREVLAFLESSTN